MATYKKFTGINNVLAGERLKDTELAEAMNVDIGVDNEIVRREGYVSLSANATYNVWDAPVGTLGTVGVDGDLKNLDTNETLFPSLGHDRVWYLNLPDGRTAFSNGLINGIIGTTGYTTWGVPLPTAVGVFTDVAGSLRPGRYEYLLTYQRISDGVEGGPVYTVPIDVVSGGVVLSGLPVLAGHRLNVYLTSAEGETAYLAGSTMNALFSFTGSNDQLVKECMTQYLRPAPEGTVSALWRARALVAVGKMLFASLPYRFEHFMMKRDVKQFTSNITLIQPVDGGIFVGTETELAFLAGTEFDKLVYNQQVAGPVVLGSGVAADGELVKKAEVNGMPRMASGAAMVCIADRRIVAGFSDGSVERMTEGRYAVPESVTEVAAVFRYHKGVPQYIAVPQ